MDGVTILAQTDVCVRVLNMTAFWIAFAITFVVIGAFVVWCIYYTDEYVYALWFIAVLAVSALLGVIFGAIFGSSECSYTKYKVTIDESVSMTQFYEKYEVLEQDGLIFTVREK